MEPTTSLTPAVITAATVVSGNITNLITKVRANGVVERGKLEFLKDQTAKVLAAARAYHAWDIVTINLEQISKTQNQIDNLQKEGRLHGTSLNMAMEQLYDLNEMLRRNLRTLESR